MLQNVTNKTYSFWIEGMHWLIK